ncbi:hypothetical protein ACFL3D_01960 [Candidatus Omnitrophota bacterium]
MMKESMNPIDKAIGIVMLVMALVLMVLMMIEHAESAEDYFILEEVFNEVTGKDYRRDYLPPSEYLHQTPSVYVSENSEYNVLTEGELYVY